VIGSGRISSREIQGPKRAGQRGSDNHQGAPLIDRSEGNIEYVIFIYPQQQLQTVLQRYTATGTKGRGR
jgi:hypothetical protein